MDTAIPVTLIVKASNQQFEDQTIKCELSWTIRKLKGYLTEVYPTRPATEEQKLIYSGQLLNDTVTLKDVLRQYDGQETHTVHLVFTSKHNNYYSSTKKMPSTKNTESNPPAASNSTRTGDGLRQRHAVNNPTTATNNTQANPSNISANMFYNIPGMTPAPVTAPTNPNDFLMAQNLAMQNWMQQAYIQYINQYMNLMSTGQVSPEALYATAMPVQQQNLTPENMNQHNSIPAAYYPFYQQMPSAPCIPTLTPLAPSQPTPPQQSSSQDHPQTENAPQNQDNVAPAPPQNDQPAAQRRFPNIVEQEQENRDWLDFFFSLCRVAVLLGVVYLYSSPTRCFVVIIIGILLYLYQIGFFRNQQVDTMELARRRVVREINAIANVNAQNRNINNDNNNNERQEPVPAAEAPERQEEEENNNTANEIIDTTETTPLVSNEASRTNMHDVAGFVRTLVLSFFTSIIPDTPAS